MTDILFVRFSTRSRAIQAARALVGIAACSEPWPLEGGSYPWKMAVAVQEGGKTYVIGRLWQFGGSMIEERTHEEGPVPPEDLSGADGGERSSADSQLRAS